MDEDEDRSIGSPEANSDNDGDETMRDVDDDDDDQGEEDMNNDDADEDDDADNDEDDENQSDTNQDNDQANKESDLNANDDDTAQSGAQHEDDKKLADSSHPRPEVLTAKTYDIVPTIAAPQSTSINAIASTSDARWLFTGGADGYIRQYNWVDSVNGKTLLTVAQRHPFVDSVIKSGVLTTYWENYDARRLGPSSSVWTTTQNLSPVYSLACHSSALWLVAGTASGAIRLQTVRHDEGKEVALLQKHTSAVSVLTLSSDEKSLLSGSWDKSVVDWDLNTGQQRTVFTPSGGQISCIELRPLSSLPVPFESGEVIKTSATMTVAEDAAKVNANEVVQDLSRSATNGMNGAASPDSLFGDGDGEGDGDGGDDDLFGNDTNANMTNGNGFGFDETDMNTAAAATATTVEEMAPTETAIAMETEALSTAPAVQPPGSPPKLETSEPPILAMNNGVPNTAPQPLANGTSHITEPKESSNNDDETDNNAETKDTQSAERPVTSDSTFLATSIDGSIRVWDRRQQDPVARIVPHDTPPWCLSACWSPDGQQIYAGRRNNTVEEYDLRQGLKRPERVFRFPQGSGAVTSVKAMPNGQHLICASYDILRLYDLKHSTTKTSVPFLIVPGHRTGTISHLHLSQDCRYMMSTGGNRGWEGQPTEVLLGYEIGVPKSV